MRSIMKMGLAAVVAALSLFSAHEARAVAPSNLASKSAVKQRIKTKDSMYGSGWANSDIGYKVFASSANPSATAMILQLTDEAGNVVNQGMVHSVCVSSAQATSDYAVLFDTAPNTAGFGVFSQSLGANWQMTPQVQGATAVEHCTTFDAQFNNGVILYCGVGIQTCHVYWRPNGGQD